MRYLSNWNSLHITARKLLSGKNWCIGNITDTQVFLQVRYLSSYQSPKPKIMRLNTPEFFSILTKDVRALHELFKLNGYEIRIAGGAVRDLLINVVPKDLDFATDATPEQMKDLFTRNNIRLINTRGESHGTITPRINETNFEVTTLRIDKITDGRHAVVEFTKDWYLDASRRDLTINSMYLDFDGVVYDYFNGYEDLLNRRVVFVGDALQRIEEDYLRILRYFRFYGRIAKLPDNHEEDVINAINEAKEGLAKISGERIWSELMQIISEKHGIEMIKKIIHLNIGPYIGFPEKCNLKELDTVVERAIKNNYVLEPISVLSSLFENTEEMIKASSRLKLSNFYRDLGCFIIENRTRELKCIRSAARIVILSKSKNNAEFFVKELLRYQGNVDLLHKFEKWEMPRFPISGKKIIEAGITDPLKTGFIVHELKLAWIESDFSLTTDELQRLIPVVSEKFIPPKKRKQINKLMKSSRTVTE